MARFGLVGSFRANATAGDALADLLIQAADVLKTNRDCELYVVRTRARIPELRQPALGMPRSAGTVKPFMSAHPWT